MSDHLTQYGQVERNFDELLSNLGGALSASEILEVKSYLAAHEYGLALEAIIDIVAEENACISRDLLDGLGSLAATLEMDMNFLRPHLARLEDLVRERRP